MELPEVAAGHTIRLSVHLLPLSHLWTLASLILCLAHLTVMPRRPLQGDQEEPTAEVVGWDGSMERWGEGMIPEKESLLYRRK